MAKRIALFNHKGGVSKTTTTFNLGWKLAEHGHRVLLVDADPQCNLSGLILGFRGETEFESYYADGTASSIRSALAPAFESQPRAIAPADCIPVQGRPGLDLLPGHIRLSEYEVTLGIAQEMSGSIQTLQNLPGAISYLLDVTASARNYDLILVDMNPSLSSINQNILMTSDYFLVPSSPDYFSLMAIESLSLVLPRWAAWAQRARSNPVLQSAVYPFPQATPRLLGTVIQNYRPRMGAPTAGFQQWINQINARVATALFPQLRDAGMTLPQEKYEEVAGLFPSLMLAKIADFNTLIAKSQKHATPVYALTEAQLENVGVVLQSDLLKQAQFNQDFESLATKIETLI